MALTKQDYIDPLLVWADMRMKTWPERYYMLYTCASDAGLVAEATVSAAGKYSCVIVDQGGVSATVDEETALNIEAKCTLRVKFGPFRVVSTDGELPFNVVGFMWPLLQFLNREGIKAGPQCGADFDHLFIFEDKIDAANRLIEEFIASAKEKAQSRKS